MGPDEVRLSRLQQGLVLQVQGDGMAAAASVRVVVAYTSRGTQLRPAPRMSACTYVGNPSVRLYGSDPALVPLRAFLLKGRLAHRWLLVDGTEQLETFT